MKKLPPSVRALALFQDLPEAAFDALSASASYRKLAKGDVLCNRGDPSNALYVLLHGQLQVSHDALDGEKVAVNLHVGPAAIGELGVIDGQPRSSDISALTAAEVAMVPRSTVLTILSGDPMASMAMLKHLTAMIRHLTQHQTILALPTASQRVCALIYQLASKQGDDKIAMHLQSINQRELAAMVNTTRETVSRTLGDLAHQGIVQKVGHKFRVLNAHLLRKKAGLS
jgi:CRP-like cAMP-binding protein